MELTRATAVVDSHTGGEPTRIIVGGGPWLKGKPCKSDGNILKPI